MTHKETAKELVDKFAPLVTTWDCYNDCPMPDRDILKDAKKCAIITVDEILDVLGSSGVYSFADPKVSEYWQEVKKEIENL